LISSLAFHSSPPEPTKSRSRARLLRLLRFDHLSCESKESRDFAGVMRDASGHLEAQLLQHLTQARDFVYN
jgi:hypothetical protein